MDVNELRVFAQVVQTGSFTAAAAALGMPKSTVSHKLSELEARLETRLVQRTTRTLSLTDAGRMYFDYCLRILAEIEAADHAVASLRDTPRGRLRVTMFMNAGLLADVLAGFMKEYPEVQLDVLCTGRTVDLVEERFDVGIRAGALPDSSLVARHLPTVHRYVVATPCYPRRRGRPRRPVDLEQHDLLLFGTGTTSVNMRFSRKAKRTEIALPARLLVSDTDILHTAAVAGLGIAILPGFLCTAELRSKRLVRLLADWTLPATPVHAVYPSTRHLSAKVKAFVEYLQRSMVPAPWAISDAEIASSTTRGTFDWHRRKPLAPGSVVR